MEPTNNHYWHTKNTRIEKVTTNNWKPLQQINIKSNSYLLIWCRIFTITEVNKHIRAKYILISSYIENITAT
jgi:hypothetical protein